MILLKESYPIFFRLSNGKISRGIRGHVRRLFSPVVARDQNVRTREDLWKGPKHLIVVQ